jgi:hypothetical protein
MNITIDWNSLILVAATAIGASALLVTLVSVGIRLFTNAQNAVVKAKGKKKSNAASKEIAYQLAALLFGAAAAAILYYGLYIIVNFIKLPVPGK